MVEKMHPIYIGIAWCLAWGEEKKSKYDLEILKRMREALEKGEEVPQKVADIVKAVRELEKLEDINQFPKTLDELKGLTEKHPLLWDSKIGLVYGGATKIKQYVFEESKLPDIRGASTRLDQINLIDLPAFFHENIDNHYRFYIPKVNEWIQKNYPELSNALIPELIIYSCGGNILAFCPAAFIDDLANAIEKRYTERTITANSCAVGDSFRLLELNFGLLRENVIDTFWLEKYRDNYDNEYDNKIVEGVFGKIDDISNFETNFINHKSFNELTTKLAILFNQRRSGNDTPNRPSRRYPPMLETHPYLRRDETEKRLAITKATNLIGEPYLSETTAIKRQVGDKAKNGRIRKIDGYEQEDIDIDLICENWIEKFEDFLENNINLRLKYCGDRTLRTMKIAESLTQLGKVSNGFIAYIYADGNNMGGYIQKIRTAKEYQSFSQDVDKATRYAVFQALADNLHPRQLQGIQEDSKSRNKDKDFIHPFEIITIGGDDIILIVPADKALEIAKDIGENFENILLGNLTIPGEEIKDKDSYKLTVENHVDLQKIHRYQWQNAKPSQCKLSISSGVLITAYNTPIYYAEDLTQQLMKSAKEYAKKLHFKNQDNKTNEDKYYGGTVDFLTMKSVTMVSSNIKDFRETALMKDRGSKLKLYAAPYTLYELGGLLQSIKALKGVDFPKSQLYQIRSFLEHGKRTASLNYYYFRSRLKQGGNILLKENFENTWCQAKTNGGNIAPWMYENRFQDTYYETIWREMVDLYEFIQIPSSEDSEIQSRETVK